MAGVSNVEFDMVLQRITDPVAVERSTIEAIVTSGSGPVIQFSKPGYTRELLRAVNQLCAEFEDKLEVRFYGHYQGHFDASALTELPDARRVSVDCLTTIVNEIQIAKLQSLTHFSFGVYRFDNPRFLETLDVARLKELTLSGNEKRNFDLAPLQECRELEELFLQGYTKNIDVISSLPKLRKIGLSGIPKHKDLQFLGGVRELRSLKLILGGRLSFDEFTHPVLEKLSVIRVRGLNTIGSLHRFPNLRSLQVEDQLQIGSITFEGAPLERVFLINCKNLAQIECLDSLQNLFELRVSRTKLDLDALVERNWPLSMTVLALYSGSRTWNEATRAKLALRGYKEFLNGW